MARLARKFDLPLLSFAQKVSSKVFIPKRRRNNFNFCESTMNPKGILNLRETCYLNSVFQALFSSKLFIKGFQELRHDRRRCKKEKGRAFCNCFLPFALSWEFKTVHYHFNHFFICTWPLALPGWVSNIYSWFERLIHNHIEIDQHVQRVLYFA